MAAIPLRDNMSSGSQPPFRVKRHLSLATAGISLAISLLVSLGVGNLIYADLKEKNGQALAEIAFHMADTLDNGIYERFGDLLQLSHRPGFPTLARNPRQLRSYFEHQQQFFPEYAWLGFVRPDGTVLAASGGLLEGKDISERSWVKAGMRDPYAGDVHDALLFSSLLPQPQDGEPLRLIDLALPVHDANNTFLGVMGAHLGWQWVKDIRNHLLTHDLKNRQIDILVLNSQGKVLLGSFGSAANGADLSHLNGFRQAKEFKVGSIFEQWPDGNLYSTGYARGKGHRDFSGLNWIVLARQSDAVARAEAAEIRRNVILLGLFIGVLTGVLCWFGAKWALRPLEQLADAALRIRQNAGIPPESLLLARNDEISTFAGTMYGLLADMSRREQQILLESGHLWSEVDRFRTVEYRLAELRRGLELRVLERTADLQDTTRSLMQVRDEAEKARIEMVRRTDSLVELLDRAEASLEFCREQVASRPDGAEVLVRITHDLELLRSARYSASQTDAEPGSAAHVPEML